MVITGQRLPPSPQDNPSGLMFNGLPPMELQFGPSDLIETVVVIGHRLPKTPKTPLTPTSVQPGRSIKDPNMCPSPGAMAAYKFGGYLGQFGGKAVTYGAALQIATAPGYLTPFTAPAAAAGTAAGALSETIGGESAFGGTTIQVVSGTIIYLQTGDWVPLYASGAPAVASALSPLNGLFGPSLEDRLQSYLESK